MDGLHITRKHVGPVLLLEEDHYVAPDFLHVLRMMESLKSMYVSVFFVFISSFFCSHLE